mgnify:CR=1 FL=1
MQTSGLKVKEFSTLESSTSLFLVPITSNLQNNISIDTCWTENPLFRNEQKRTIFTTISNQSKTNLKEQAVFLELNGKQKSQQYINLKGEESKTISFTFTKDKNIIQKGVIKVNDHLITAQSWHNPGTIDYKILLINNFAKKISVEFIE